MRVWVMWWSLVQTPVAMWLMESPTLHTLLTTLLMDISLQTSELAFGNWLCTKLVFVTYLLCTQLTLLKEKEKRSYKTMGMCMGMSHHEKGRKKKMPTSGTKIDPVLTHSYFTIPTSVFMNALNK